MSFKIKNGVLSKYSEEENVKDVIIPDGVTCIGNRAFFDCGNITRIVIPDSVTDINPNAFEKCYSLTRINIPANVNYIDGSAFEECKSLTEITADENNSFYCDINGVLFSKDKKTIISFPAGKTETAYIVPDTVDTIDEEAFSDCSNLTNITIPYSVNLIDNNSFVRCHNLTDIKVSPDNKSFCDIDGVLFSRDKKTIIYFPNGKSESIYIIPDGVTSISDCAFENCCLSEIVIPNSVNNIGFSAFENCRYLTDITIPENVSRIDEWTFCDCHNLKSIVIPDSVTSICSSAFSYCYRLSDIAIPQNISYMGYMVFEECANLKTASVPSHLKGKLDNVFPKHTKIAYR